MLPIMPYFDKTGKFVGYGLFLGLETGGPYARFFSLFGGKRDPRDRSIAGTLQREAGEECSVKQILAALSAMFAQNPGKKPNARIAKSALTICDVGGGVSRRDHTPTPEMSRMEIVLLKPLVQWIRANIQLVMRIVNARFNQQINDGGYPATNVDGDTVYVSEFTIAALAVLDFKGELNRYI